MSDYEPLAHGRIKVPLTGDDWAEVRTAPTMTGGDRAAILAAVDAAGVNLQSLGFAGVNILQRTAALHMTHAWTLTGDDESPLPITAGTLAALSLDVEDALVAAVMPVVARLMKRGRPDPKSEPSSSQPPALGG